MPNLGPRFDIYSLPKEKVLEQADARSMVSTASIYNAFDLCMDVQEKQVPGCFVECGIWHGGCVIAMAYAAVYFETVNGRKADGNLERKTWGFDSFEGVPAITEKDGIPGYGKGAFAVSIESVDQAIYWNLKLKRKNVFLVKGWFETTLPLRKADVGPIAVLRLDADWYQSTMDAFTNLYDQVSVGGWVVIDDYGAWPGCRKATNEFFISRGWLPKDFVTHNFAPWLEEIENGGQFFQKTLERV